MAKSDGKIRLEDLYFGVVLRSFSCNRSDRDFLKVRNLFDFLDVKLSVACWVVMTPEERKRHDPLMYIFGSVRGRTEYEYIVCPWPYRSGETVEECGTKVDIYMMYVEPNADYLLSVVHNVSTTSAKKYLTEWRKRYKR